MLFPLENGTILQNRYEVIAAFGSWEKGAAYVVNDLDSPDLLLLWESAEIFGLRTRPPGVRSYFRREDRHYLVLTLEGQTLSLLLAAAGRLDEEIAARWMFQICQAIGFWHNREQGALICLQQGHLALSHFTLSKPDQVMVPSYGAFACQEEPLLPTDTFCFSAPEDRENLSPRSDVYALGAMLYCLLVGQPTPEPADLVARRTGLTPLRRINRAISPAMERIVHKALQLDPRRRYPTATEMAADLADLLGLHETRKTKSRRKPSLLARIASLILVISLVVALVVVVDRLTRPEIEISWPKGPPTPTFTPGPVLTPTDTPTPTPVPAAELVLNQVRTDRFPQVIAYVSVLNEHQEPVLGLQREQFRVRQDSVDVDIFILDLVSAADDPLSLVVAMDISGSMKGEPLQKAKGAAANFISRFDPADEVSLIKFDDRIKVVHDFTADKEAVIAAVNGLRTRGDTALYDVVARSVAQMADRAGRRAVIILTDGRDTASVKHSLSSCVKVANAAGVPLFVIGLDSQQFTPQVMEELATATGGEYLFAPSPDDLDSLYQKIRGQLQNQYRIEFASQHGPDEAEHTLSVSMDIGAGQEIQGEKQYRIRSYQSP